MQIDNDIEDTIAESLSETLKSNTTLTKLDLSGDDKRKKTHKRHISTIHSFSILITSTDNEICETGVKALSEALKSNTTLTKLNLDGVGKKKEGTQKISINNSFVSVLKSSTANKVRDTGATSLSEALKSNTTLTELDLTCEYETKGKKTKDVHQQFTLFHSHHINRERHWKHRSNINE